MKPPREPKTFKWPRLYWTDVDSEDELYDLVEMRIIYPCGKYPDRVWSNGFFEHYGIIPRVCWFDEGMTPQEQVKAFKNLCKREGTQPIFVGEIKP